MEARVKELLNHYTVGGPQQVMLQVAYNTPDRTSSSRPVQVVQNVVDYLTLSQVEALTQLIITECLAAALKATDGSMDPNDFMNHFSNPGARHV